MAARFWLEPVLPGLVLPIELSPPLIVVGTHSHCDVIVSHPSVSRRHCVIASDHAKDEAMIRDLGSTGGIHVNQQRVEMARLLPGDLLRIGVLEYLVRRDVIEQDD